VKPEKVAATLPPPAQTRARRRLGAAVGLTLSFILPCCVALLAMLVNGMFPFGDDSLESWDLKYVYTYAFEWYRDVLQGDANLFYSFSKSLGGNMVADWAYLVASPFNVLIVFFGDNPLDFISFQFVVKFGLAGLTAFIYISRRFSLPMPTVLLLSICYSHMFFMSTQSINPMWMDAVVLLPLVLLGIDALISRGRFCCLTLSLAVAIVSSFYNGYMLCLFAILYYVFECFRLRPPLRLLASPARPRLLRHPLRFVGAGIMALMLSAPVLAPTLLELASGKGSEMQLLYLGANYDLLELVRSFFSGVYEMEHLPQIFCGTIVTLSVIWFFFNRGIARREKAAMAALLAIILASTWLVVLERVWLGFRDGNAFYCRFAFLASAVMIIMAARNMESLAQVSRRGVLAGIAVTVAMTLAFILEAKYLNAVYPAAALLSCLLAYVLFSRASLLRKTRFDAALRLALVAVVAVEGALGLHLAINVRNASYGIVAYSDYGAYFRAGDEMVAFMEGADGGAAHAWRAEKEFNYLKLGGETISVNEPMAFGYHGLVYYNSSFDSRVRDIMNKLGYTPDYGWRVSFNDNNLAADSLLGLRYLVTDTPYPWLEEVAGAPLWAGAKLYENPYALPLGFIADAAVLERIEANGNPFDYQEAYLSAALGADAALFTPVEARLDAFDSGQVSWTVTAPEGAVLYGYIEGENVMYSRNVRLVVDGEPQHIYMNEFSQGVFPILASNAAVSAADAAGSAGVPPAQTAASVAGSAATTGSAATAGSAAVPPAQAAANAAGSAAVPPAQTAASVAAAAGSAAVPPAQAAGSAAVPPAQTAGSAGVPPAQSATGMRSHTVALQGGLVTDKGPYVLHLAMLDTEQLSRVSSTLAARPLSIERFEDGYVSGTCQAKAGEILLTTIPYDPGWEISLNGAPAQPLIVQDAFIALRMEDGLNTIEMSYLPPGGRQGLFVGGLGLLAFIASLAALALRGRRHAASVLPEPADKDGADG
jgi:uncharacterized membrane protein YfhO